MTLAAAKELVELPDGAVPEHGVTILSFIDEVGDLSFAFATHGDGSYSSVLGLLSMVSHELLHIANPTRCEAEDD